MSNRFILNGVVPPVITPVDGHENVEPEGFRRVLDYVMNGGVHGIFVNGSNGEFYGLDFENQKRAVEICVEHVNGKIPVYAGASAITTKESIKLVKMATAAGADVITVLTPMFIQPSEDELFDHFSSIAASSSLPVVLYNNPGKTLNNISPALLKRLMEVENIIGIKNTSMDFSLTMKYLNISQQRDDFHVFSGIDYYIYATLVHGGSGCVAGTANVAPSLVVDIFNCYMRGDHNCALAAQNKLMAVRDMYNYGTFPVMMKVCMNLLGLDVGKPILPVQNVSDEVVGKARTTLIELGLLK